MNNEDFVTYDIAVRLKKAGFDWPCKYYYTKDNAKDENVWLTFTLSGKENFNRENKICRSLGICSAPTLAQAQKWLREVLGIHIAVIGNYDCSGNLYAFEVWLQGVPGGRQVLQYETKRLSDHESALSAGIEAALKLIEEGEG